MDEDGEMNAEAAAAIADAATKNVDEITDRTARLQVNDPALDPFMNGEIKTLDGDIAGDEFAADAINYQVLLGKIDKLLEKLKLDA